MADQGSLSARDVHIQWSFALPGLQVCQFEGGQEASWFSESLLSPCAFLFCQTGGMQFYLDHGQVIDLNPHDILLLSAGACIQRIQSAAPCSCGIRMTLRRGSLRLDQVLAGPWDPFAGGTGRCLLTGPRRMAFVPQWALEQRIFFSADGSSHGQTGRVLCTQRCGASLSPVRKGAFSDGASWPAVLGPRPD